MEERPPVFFFCVELKTLQIGFGISPQSRRSRSAPRPPAAIGKINHNSVSCNISDDIISHPADDDIRRVGVWELNKTRPVVSGGRGWSNSQGKYLMQPETTASLMLEK